MFYRITMTLNISHHSPPELFKPIIAICKEHGLTINPSSIHAEPSHFISQKCFHDEGDRVPCQVLEHWESPV